MSIIISIISGIATGIGLGGGTILIIGLTTILEIERKIAQSINLIFFVPTAIISIILNWKNKNIRWKVAIYIVISSIIGVIFGTIIAIRIDTKILKKLFGFFIGIIAIYELYNIITTYIKNKKSNNKRKRNGKEEMLNK